MTWTKIPVDTDEDGEKAFLKSLVKDEMDFTITGPPAVIGVFEEGKRVAFGDYIWEISDISERTIESVSMHVVLVGRCSTPKP
jgi:hypothetical protein